MDLDPDPTGDTSPKSGPFHWIAMFMTREGHQMHSTTLTRERSLVTPRIEAS